MSNAPHYRSNLRDLNFNLFEFLRVQDNALGHGPFQTMDEDSARGALVALEQLCTEELANSFVESDRVPLKIDADGNVTLPEGVKKSLHAYLDSGFDRMELPEHLGGFAAPPTMTWAGFELLAGANPIVAYYAFGTFIAKIVDDLGTEAQKKRVATPMLEKRWGGSMVLTEPDAGSDVGAGRAKAKHLEGDVWAIEGVKRFITNGDFDAVENIVHLVLARPEGAGAGTKGLSLFIVPKFWINEDGSMGERNGVYCTNLEKKMGIKGSATCELTFGERGVARGLLVGEKHDGIRQMFHVIEQARMAVGMKSMATLSSGYLHALDYAKQRIQGPDLLRATDKTAPRVEILRHPDVRRMLMAQKSGAEGMRALALYTASIQDQVAIAGGHGAPAAASLEALNDLLLPLVKGYCSERAFELLTLSLQTFGGSGYCQDYPIEQYLRDQKIDTLYEGTTAIQALDLILRKIAKDGGTTLRSLLGQVQKTIETQEGGPALEADRQALAKGLGELNGIFGALMGKIGESLYHVGLHGNKVLFAVAELVIGWLLVRQAAVAVSALPTASEEDRGFYSGKLAVARYWSRQVLPGLTLTRKLVEQSTLELMEMHDEAF